MRSLGEGLLWWFSTADDTIYPITVARKTMNISIIACNNEQQVCPGISYLINDMIINDTYNQSHTPNGLENASKRVTLSVSIAYYQVSPLTITKPDHVHSLSTILLSLGEVSALRYVQLPRCMGPDVTLEWE